MKGRIRQNLWSVVQTGGMELGNLRFQTFHFGFELLLFSRIIYNSLKVYSLVKR